MSADNNVGKVSRSLQKKRYAEKQKHTKNSFKPRYDAEMWNSGDYQFFALWKERIYTNDSRARRYSFDSLRLTFFGYNYVFWTNEKEKHLTKVEQPIRLRPNIVQGLRDFLVQKPAGETFIIPDFRGSFHLSFAKRSLFGPSELKWRFLNDKEEWLDAFKLPRKEKKRTLKDLKLRENRHKLWFAEDQSDKLIAYLDAVLPEYATLPPDAFRG